MRFCLSLAAITLIISTATAQKEFGFDNKKSTAQPYLTPEETVKRMKVAPEFEVKLFAGEPQVVNPVAFTIDEKGRVWVLECFEYPNRTPAGKMPRDRIVILEDTDGDGACDKRTVFAEGKDFPERFDLATGLEVGNGGVYVGAPPYLYFIENKNDKPGTFTKLLSGFGSQDTHETLNTFQWGPDGWLYGLHGIYTQSNVKNVQLDGPEHRMNAAVWRYHPKTKKFETYAEGTSNPWGMDWRNTDGQFILCACVIPHLYHIVPGGIYRRQGGASQNPYAYGYINEICDHTFHKESGWAHAGLISLDVPHIPEKYRNSVIFGSIHGSSLKQNILKPNGSTYTASRGDDFLVSGDKNFRPINMKWGPQGDIYLIDWHDQNPCHQAAADSWDQTRGRVYRIQLKGTKLTKVVDLSRQSPEELARFALNGRTPWHRRTALRLLGEMADDKRLLKSAINPVMADEALADESPDVRLRAEIFVRVIGSYLPATSKTETDPRIRALRLRYEMYDDQRLPPPDELWDKSGAAQSPLIRRELASALQRLTYSDKAVTLAHALMSQADDFKDPLIPLLIWNGYSQILMNEKNHATELTWLSVHAPGNALVRDVILPRAMRQFASSEKHDRCIAFVTSCSDSACREKALEGLAIALKDRHVTPPANWAALRAELVAMKNPRIDAHVMTLAVVFRDPEAVKAALAAVKDATLPVTARVEAVKQLAFLKPAETPKLFIDMLKADAMPAVQIEAARALAAFNDPGLSLKILHDWKSYRPEVQGELVNTLAARKESALVLLNAVKAKTVDRMLLSDSHITRMQVFKDAAINKLIEEAWGKSRATPADLVKQIDAMRKDLAEGSGSFAKGKVVFDDQCGKCHKFDGKGSDVGPALDGAGRDIEYILANVLDPNRVIGAPYFIRQATTQDGQVIQGVLAEEDDRTLTLKIEQGVLKKIAKADLDGPVKVLERSLMPEGLSAGMKPQDFRDMVRYLMAHPFVAKATVNGKAVNVPVNGLIPLPEVKDGAAITLETKFTAADAVNTKLLIGSGNPFEVFLDGKSIAKGHGTERKLTPDSESFDVTLPKGDHTLKLLIQPKWASAGVYVRFLDPNRRISYEND